VLRACAANGWPVPEIVGVELDDGRAVYARRQFAEVRSVRIEQRDFLQPADRTFDYVIGNPPYVSILDLIPAERLAYRAAYRTARGRFDLYVLFFEQALRLASQARVSCSSRQRNSYTCRPRRRSASCFARHTWKSWISRARPRSKVA
jgi:adenine-specific DNA-methyltransferase